jgi:hypothetical protein
VRWSLVAVSVVPLLAAASYLLLARSLNLDPARSKPP